jgi:hypothetical protein
MFSIIVREGGRSINRKRDAIMKAAADRMPARAGMTIEIADVQA